MMAHALFSASAASRWLACPGSIALSQGASGSGSSRASAEGTLLHSLSEQLLRHGGDAVDLIGSTHTVEGFEFEVDDEMAISVNAYVEYVRGFSGTHLYEIRSDYSGLIGLPAGEGFGTSDCVVYQEADKVLHVIDAKFGRGYVSPVNNKQLILYAAGTVYLLVALGHDIEQVVLHIVQPRVTAKPAPFTMTLSEMYGELDGYKESVIRAKEAMTSYINNGIAGVLPYLEAGETQCQWCPAKVACPRLQAIANGIESADLVTCFDGGKLAEMYSKLGLLKIYADAVEAEVVARLNTDRPVPGYKMVLGREGNRKWVDDEKAAALLSTIKDVPEDELWKPKSPRTLPQVEKVLKKHKITGIDLDQYQVRSPAKPTVATADDPRPSWSAAEQVDDEFSVI